MHCLFWPSRFSHVRLCVTLRTVAGQAPLSVGILQARILEWVVMPSSRGYSRPRDWTRVSYISCIGRRILYHECHLGSPLSLVSELILSRAEHGMVMPHEGLPTSITPHPWLLQATCRQQDWKVTSSERQSSELVRVVRATSFRQESVSEAPLTFKYITMNIYVFTIYNRNITYIRIVIKNY